MVEAVNLELTEEEIKNLEEREQDIKEEVGDLLNDKGELITTRYKVKLRSTKRNTVPIKNLPKDIIEKYSETTTFHAIYLTKNKEEKRRRHRSISR